jgi:hypothetical protein
MDAWTKALVLWICLLLPLPAAALDILASAGRLEKAESDGTCSAALIAADLIITAAHCVNPQKDIEPEAPRLFYRPAAPQFAPPVAVIGGARHPLYSPERDDLRWKFPFDLVVLRLERALPDATNPALALGAVPRAGESLTLVTWIRSHEGPVIRPCPVLPGPFTLVTLGCPVRGGESGGAVLRTGKDGAELVAILTSRSRIGDLEIAQASHVDGRLAPMLRLLED